MTSPTRPLSRWRRILLSLVVIFAGSLGLIAWCIYDVVTPSREVAGWRNFFLSARGGLCSTTVQVSAGRWLLAIARLGISQIKEVPPEVLVALRSVRSASVGVYQLSNHHSIDPTTVEASDQRMRRQGWRRAVAVRDGESTVLIYTPESAGRGEELRICLAVFDGQNLVLVSGTVEGRYLVPLISQQFGQRSGRPVAVEQI